MFKKVFAWILTLALVLSPIAIFPLPAIADNLAWEGDIAESFAGGTGTETDPYQIANGSQLALLAKNVNSGISYHEEYFIQTADIDLGDYDWTPIGGGQGYCSFSGSYQGNGHSIVNMTLALSESESAPTTAGLFGIVGTEAHIEGINLSINSILVTSKDGDIIIGGIAGDHSSPCTIKNCTVTINGSITAEVGSGSGSVLFGGIAGRNTGAIRDCTTNFSPQSDVKIKNTSDEAYVGGIVGYNNGDIFNCDNTGTLHAEAEADPSLNSGTYRIYAGGIAGYVYGDFNNAVIENCQNNADIECINHGDLDNSFRAYAGGIVGHIDVQSVTQVASVETIEMIPDGVQIINCANIGADKRVYTKAPTTMTGGIAGSSRFVPESVPSIINSYNRSNIISEMSQFPPDSKRHPCSGITAGGIIGAAGGANIFYSYSTASEVSATPLANEDAYVGGIAGLMYGTQFQQNYYESNANVSVGIGGTITEDKEIVPQADIPSAVSPATQEDLKTKGFFDEGWQWYERGGDAPQFYSRTHPWRFTVEAGFANDGYPALRGNPNAQPPNQDLVAATNLVAKDPDNSYLGVDGRDFQVTWTPSVSSQTTGQSIFILPEDILLDTTIHQAIVVFADNTTKQWHGTADLKTDSAGNSLKGGNYIIYLISYNDEQSAQTSTIMTAISETSRSPGGGGSSDPTPIYSVTRLSGQNRVDTALEIAKAIYPKTVSNVVLATANTFPDALSGSVLAYKAKAPILLVGSSASDQEKILSYLESYLDKSGTVYILGGTSAVSQEMEGKIKLKGFNNITRLGGKDRYETALKIAEHLDLKSGTPLVFVNGENFSDALSISSTAAALQYPILLIQNNGISNSVKVKLSESKPTKVYLIGLEGVISKDLESQISQISTLDTANIVRIGGVNRYETSLAVVKAFKLSSHKICIATGNDFPDALLGSLYAANATAPMLLIDRTLSDNTLEYLKSQNFDNITIFGGEGAVKKEIEQKLLEAIKK